MSTTYEHRAGRGSMTKSGGGGGERSGPPKQSILVTVKSFDLVDPRKKVADYDKDKVTVLLEHNIDELDIQAQFDEEGNPITEMVVTMPVSQGSAGRQVGVFEMYRGKDQFRGQDARRQAVPGQGQQGVRAELAPGRVRRLRPDRRRSLQRRRADVRQRHVLPSPRGPQEGRRRLGSERHPGTDGRRPGKLQHRDRRGRPPRQVRSPRRPCTSRTTAWGRSASPSWRAALAPADATPEQAAQFALDPSTRFADFVVAKPKHLGKDSHGENVFGPAPTTDEVFAKLWDRGEAGRIRSLMAQPDSNHVFEFVPLSSIRLGPKSVASKNARDPSVPFRVYERTKEEGKFEHSEGWTSANISILRVMPTPRSEPEEIEELRANPKWFIGHVTKTSGGGNYFVLPDLPTANMDEAHLTAVYTEAARLNENSRAFWKANPPARKEQTSASTPKP